MFHEDLPYAAQQPGLKDYSSYFEWIIPHAKLQVCHESLVTKDKYRLLQFYGSQLTMSQIRMVQDYARRIHRRIPVERLWAFSASTVSKAGGKIPDLMGHG